MHRSASRRLGRSSVIAVILAAMFVFPFAANAQTDQGRIAGTITDSHGGLVPGATIVVKNDRTGEERTATTNDVGYFIVSALRPSTYSVSANAKDLSAKTTNVELLVGQEFTLTMVVQPTGVAETVVVSADSEVALETNSAAMGANVNPREVEGLPINGRQLSQLYLQAPGSVNSGSGTFSDIRFSGRAVQQNIVRYDGIEGSAIIDASPGNLNGEIATPFRLQSSLENVQEFRVDSNNYPAEFGTGTGGQINVVTKSGGNQFHGSVFEYFRNDKLDASNFFDNIVGTKSPLRLNQFGGSVGGPIVKDKLFFFGSYEGYRLRAGVNSVEAVPGEAARICPAIAPATCNATQVSFLPAFRAPNAVIVSRGTGSNLFDVAQLQATSSVNEDAFSARFDYKINAANSAYFRFFRDQGTNVQPEGVTGRRVFISSLPQNAVAGWQTIISPALLNEFKFGYNGAKTRINGQAPTINGLDLSAIVLNISANTANFNLPGQGASAGTAAPGGLVRANSATNGRGQPYTPYSLSFVDSLNYIRGSHSFRFGGEFRAIRLYTDRLGGTTYTYASLQNYLTASLASVQFVDDLSSPSPFTGDSGQRFAEQEYYIGYAQDQWQVRPGLTLNYGLRYEYYAPLREKNDGQVLFDITTGTFRDPAEAAYKTSKNGFGPRVALSWSPNSTGSTGSGFFGGGKSILRGGFGIYYGPGQTEDQIQPIESDRIQTTITSGTLLAFPANLPAIVANFVGNPNNRSYQPRAYSSEYLVPERVYQYSFSYQQELPGQMVGTVAYVGAQGRNLFLRSVANQILRGQATISSTATSLPADAGVVNILNAAGTQVTAVRTVREFSIPNGNNVLNPFAEVDFKTSGGSDSYNALQAQLTRRFGTGLTMNAQYTFGKSVGTTAGSNEARTAANNARTLADWEYDRSVNNFDVRHTFNLSALYDLPIGKGKRFDWGTAGNAIFGNWEVGAILNARSGLPIEVGIVRPDLAVQCVNVGGCTINTSATATTVVPQGFTAQLPTVSAANPLPVGFVAVANVPGGGASRNVRRPDLVPGVSPYLNNDRNILNPAAFAIPVAGAFGNLGRNALRGPSFSQADLIFAKRFAITETVKLQFRTEVFNVFNHPNFALPAATINVGLPTMSFNTTANAFVLGSGLQPGQGYTQSAAGSAFGLLRQTVERTVGLGTSRQVQFALRLSF